MASQTKSRQVGNRETRRAVIAQRLIEQKSTSQIGAELGLSRKTVWEEANRPETKALIQSWMQQYHEEIKAEIPKAIAAVRDELAPGMPNRLAAVKTLGTVLEWAEGSRNGDTDGTPRRWSGELVELLALYARIRPE